MMKTHFEHSQFTQFGPSDICACASDLGIAPGVMLMEFQLQHAGVFVFEKMLEDGTASYKQTPGFMTAVIFND